MVLKHVKFSLLKPAETLKVVIILVLQLTASFIIDGSGSILSVRCQKSMKVTIHPSFLKLKFKSELQRLISHKIC